jgi:hypothetical protein
MKITLTKILLIFLAITGATTILFNYTNVEFGHIDYFNKHGLIFLTFLAIFPRVTLLFSGLLLHSIEFGGIIWWASFLLAPRILVATLATISYWNTNPFLVTLSWLIALGGESSEKIFIKRNIKPQERYDNFKGTTIEAEYSVKKE